jgi:cytoskeletal protein CcmA (bactofilin family)
VFTKTSKKDSGGNEVVHDKEAVPSILSADLTIKGDIISRGELQIDGQVEGDIKSTVLLVGESAKVKGEINAETVQVHGTIEGEIRASSVFLSKNARVVGNIFHDDLSIERGAFLEGLCKPMEETEKKGKNAAKDDIDVVVGEPAGDGQNAGGGEAEAKKDGGFPVAIKLGS